MITILAIYILLRLFKLKHYLEGDELRHLKCAKSFYKLWNNQTYDAHPPLYSWVVRQFSHLLPDYIAGAVVSLLASIGLFFAANALYIALGLSPSQRIIALALLTFNYTLIYYSNRCFRYELLACIGTWMLWAFVIGKPFLGGLLWGLLALTCVFAGLRGWWAWLLASRSLWGLFGVILALGSWLATKACLYTYYTYYPAGLDGKIERVKGWGWKQLISPLYFPWNYAYYGKKELGKNWKGLLKKLMSMYGIYNIENRFGDFILQWFGMCLILYTIIGMYKAPLWLVAWTLIMLWPATYKRFLARNSIVVIPVLYYFIARAF